ncbi:MAG: hypothetical protein ABIE42_08530 [Candidatus Eisenbacteria bacterium]
MSCVAEVIRASVAAGIPDRRAEALPRGEEATLFGMPVTELAALIRRKNRLEGATIEIGWRLAFLGECRRPTREHADVYLFFGGEDDEARFVSDCRKAYASSPRRVVMLGAGQVRLSVEHLLVLKGLGVSAIALTERHPKSGWRLPWDQILDTKSAVRHSHPEDVQSVTYCRVITHEGTCTMNRDEYTELLEHRSEYDMFIDGMSHEAITRDGKSKPRLKKLTTMQQTVLFAVIVARKPIRACDTEAWENRPSKATANHMFERARAKADVKLRRHEYRAFRTHKNARDPQLKTFEFAPPDDLRFCVIIPDDDQSA